MKTLESSLSDAPVSRRWTAQWIGPAPESERGTRSLFRRTVEVGNPSGCRLYISAERDYELYVNGLFVARGVPPSPYYYKYYDECDLSEVLQPGANCIAVLVSQIGAPHTALLAEMCDGGGTLVSATDASWRVTSRTGWAIVDTRSGVQNTRFQEYFDARRHPEDWRRLDYDDSTWPHAEAYPPFGTPGNPWPRMVPRQIPQLAEWEVEPRAITRTAEGLDLLSRHRCESLSVQLSAAEGPVAFSRIDNADALCKDGGETTLQVSTRHNDDPTFDGIYAPSVVLDFGKVITGYLFVELDGVSGARLDIGYVERLLNGHFNNAIEVNYADRYVMKDGPQRFLSTIWKGFRYVKLRLTHTEEPVRINRVGVRICTYDYQERGGFESDDQTLNKVFDICRYTIRLCSRDFLMDTPWRERNQWLGDNSAVTVPGIYACFGDTSLPRQFLLQALATPLPTGILVNNSQLYDPIGASAKRNQFGDIVDYSLWWIQAIWKHYQFTGDARIVHMSYPHVTTVLDYHWRYMDQHGLLGEFPTHTFIDHVFKPGAKITAAYNALWYGTLAYALQITELIGDTDTAHKVKESMALIEANFQEAFFDDDLKLFQDGFIDGKPGAGVSEHSNTAAILYGLADGEQTASIIGRLYDDPDIDFLEAEPFFSVVALAALCKAGRTDLALRIIRDRWGRRMVERGMTSVVEEWRPSISRRGPGRSFVGIYRSLSHAWSACPAEFLIRGLTGFEILEPGCARVRITPFAADFVYNIAIPTPRGDISVRWNGSEVQTDAPQEVNVEVGAQIPRSD